ncbi:unnamed protein product [Rhizopus stolonifer]
MTDNVTVQFIVLFTAQKAKKFKTWQDGTLKYFTNNKKLVLTDEKGYNIDRKFTKAGVPSIGDEIEFDGHIVTIESYDESVAPTIVEEEPVASVPALRSNLPEKRAPIQQQQQPSFTPNNTLKSKFVSPLKRKQRLISVDPDELDDSMGTTDAPTTKVENTFTPNPPVTENSSLISNSSVISSVPLISNPHVTSNFTPAIFVQPMKDNTSVNYTPPVKKVRYGLARPSAFTVNNNTEKSVLSIGSSSTSSFTKASNITESLPNESTPSTSTKPFKSPFVEGVYTSAILQFPSSRKAITTLKTKKYPKRTKVVPTKFSNVQIYRETFKKIIYEHLDILLLNYSIYFYSIYEKYGSGKRGNELERTIRSKGLGMYVDCEIKADGRFQDTRYRLMIRNKEHYSKYNKDDIWVISKSPTFEASQTFLAKSIFFGPFSNGSLEVDCISPRDSRVASKVTSESSEVYALRTITASTEFMMLDTLEGKLDNLPMLRYILGEKSKKKDLLPVPAMERIQLRRDDCINMDTRLAETVALYKLNADQESVLRRVASSVIHAPGWNNDSEHPVVLVHGVYGSGKSFLAAVIIIFIEELIDAVNKHREPDDQIQFKILVSSMTNVAVDRILQTLLKLGYDEFVRIGSMKKIAKNLLPFTAKAKLSSNEELKELEQMLDDGQNSEEDADHIATAIQHFRKSESVSQIHTARVVGTTFMSSVFDVFNDVRFPLVLVDESSQLMEPLTMVPLARFSCNRLVMIGDPLQLPPTLASPSEEGKIGQGLDKTLFDRFIEMGHESIMLRTQYRCHPKISAISNKLFYERRLVNGVTAEDRKPLVEGLPTVIFLDVGGTEQKSPRTNSFWNDTEVGVAAYIIQSMVDLKVNSYDMGVISLYKEQSDKLSERLNATGNNSLTKSIQISTVDAFQGGEKDVIILSTVRTTESAFMHNQPRINVALTRAKRHLIILGNRNLLGLNEFWSKIIWDCEGKKFIAKKKNHSTFFK